MDLNLHVGLPPLPRPRVRLDTSAASPALMPNSAAPEAPRTSEPEESLVPAAATYSLSNALSALEEHPMLDPIVYSWLDGNSAGGEEYTDAPEPSAPAPVDGLLVARSVRPSRVAAATGMEMVNTSTLGQSTQGAAATAIEAGAPELRFLRVIQISQQHNIVRPGSANLSQSSFEAARGQNLDGGDNSSFDCNICLELARQPVVTSCGHLFCWPCLYLSVSRVALLALLCGEAECRHKWGSRCLGPRWTVAQRLTTGILIPCWWRWRQVSRAKQWWLRPWTCVSQALTTAAQAKDQRGSWSQSRLGDHHPQTRSTSLVAS
jgi:hypothetical protein